MRRSFRSQLALRATVAVAIGLAALSAVTLWTLGALLDREIDASILNIAAIQAASLADGPRDEMHFHEWELTPDEAASVRDLVHFAQVWDAGGASLLRNQYMTSDLPLDPEALARASAGDLTWTRQDYEGASVRTVFYPLERLGAAHEAHVLQVAAPLSQRNGMLARAGTFLGLLTVLLAAGTYAGSWWLAGSAVRPIHAVIDQAEAVGAGSLDRRIEAYAETAEYRRLVEVLNTMLGRLHGAFEAQRRFTADASHELRSPLTVMRGEIEVTLRRERPVEEYVTVLESTLEEAERLSRISEDLLTLARADARMLEPRREPVNPLEVVERVAERLRPKAARAGVTLEVREECPPTMSLDPTVLGQVLWNLIDNALEHAPEDSTVGVRVARRGTGLVLEVSDEGPGLGDADPDLLFERFFRGDAVRSHGERRGSTGLGLAIVRALADAHGGRAFAENREEGGARFTVELAAE